MSENAMIQQAARGSITGFGLHAMLGTLIYALITGAAGSLYGLSLLIGGPISVGYVLFCMKIMDDRTADYNSLFAPFCTLNTFVQTMLAGLIYSVIVALGCLLLVVPGIIAALGLSMTFIIMAEDDKIEGIDAIQMSWDMMKGHKWELFCLWCRFIGWALLSILTFGILALWVEPWTQMSTINFYRKLKYNQY